MSTDSFTNAICIYCVFIATEGFFFLIMFYIFFSTEVPSDLDQGGNPYRTILYLLCQGPRNVNGPRTVLVLILNTQFTLHADNKISRPQTSAYHKLGVLITPGFFFFLIPTDLVSFFITSQDQWAGFSCPLVISFSSVKGYSFTQGASFAEPHPPLVQRQSV